MIHALRAKLFSAPVAIFALMLTLTSGSIKAGEKPFKINGIGIADFIPVVPGTSAGHFAVGKGTGLGEYYGEGNLTLIDFTSPTTAEFKSTFPFVFYGEEATLACDYGINPSAGVVTLVPSMIPGKFYAVFVANFTAVPAQSTGKFKKITGGGFKMIAVSEPFVPGVLTPTIYVWKGEGSFKYKGK